MTTVYADSTLAALMAAVLFYHILRAFTTKKPLPRILENSAHGFVNLFHPNSEPIFLTGSGNHAKLISL